MTVPISVESEDEDVPLSEKTRRRLQELGITELFAGMYTKRSMVSPVWLSSCTVQTAVIPFLMLNKKHRRLYLPYDPPHDICVSAPTGSGKTLAYVLPIVEVRPLAILSSP